MSPDGTFERFAEYFQNSSFEYLALDYAGRSLRLSRERTRVLASSVGFIALPAGRERFPEAGAHVVEGEALFAVRRFRNVIAVRVPASGILESVLVSKGDFVEFGQPLATVWISK